jgi:plastocyanin domain-containing protein
MLQAMNPARGLRARFVSVVAAGLLVGACKQNESASLDAGHVIQVTDEGFEPKVIEVKKGEPVTLIVTRRSDHTCATEMIFAGNDSTYDLPYQKKVVIHLAPMTGDTLRYACGMDMYSGILVAK